VRRLDCLAGHGSERIKVGAELRGGKSVWIVDGVTIITAKVAISPLIVI
jgi:hypothetical protein